MNLKLAMAQEIARNILSNRDKFSWELLQKATIFANARNYWAGKELDSPNYSFEDNSEGWKYILEHKAEWEGKL